MNLLLLIFNLVPAFPLDGGRIARAIAWRVTDDRAKGTIFSAWLGQGFGFLLIGYGAYVLLSDDGGNVGGALWWLVLGYLIMTSARSAQVSARVTDRLEGIRVEDVMDREPLAMPATTTVMEAEDRWFGGDGGWPWYPVDRRRRAASWGSPSTAPSRRRSAPGAPRSRSASCSTTARRPGSRSGPTSRSRWRSPPSRCAGWAPSWPWTPKGACAASSRAIRSSGP